MIYILLDLCNDSRFLRILYLFKVVTKLICLVVPILLIVVLMIEVTKAIINSDNSKINELKRKGIKRIVAAVVVFLVPTFVTLFLSLFNFSGYSECIENLTLERINSLKDSEDDTRKADLKEKEEQLKKNQAEYEEYLKEHVSEAETGGGFVTPTPGNDTKDPISDTNKDCSYEYKNTKLTEEPNPIRVVACWPDKVSVSNFVGKDNLGAWPTSGYVNNIGSCGSNQWLFPVTGAYGNQGTDHGGVDIGWTLGTPVYAPASGSGYFMWGSGGDNQHGGESTYSMSITLSSPFKINVDGKTMIVKSMWIGHMLGLTHRGSFSVKQGDLIGFRGNGCYHMKQDGSKEYEVCWAPHIHWSVSGVWDDGTDTKVVLDNEQFLRIFNLGGLNGSVNKNAGECFNLPSINPNKKYTVTFKLSGGILNNNNQDYKVSVSDGDKVNNPGSPTFRNKTFLGWYTSSSGGTKVLFPLTVTKNMTIYARYANGAVSLEE